MSHLLVVRSTFCSSPALLAEARGWLEDCGLRVPLDPIALSNKIERFYDGGLARFVEDTYILC